MKQYIVTTDKGNTFTIRANNQYEAKQRTYLCNEKIRSIQGVTKSGKLQKKNYLLKRVDFPLFLCPGVCDFIHNKI